ncbi:MAG: hypothetical protein PHU25_13950 [Deltaproteobacteria bacterium]|nr:hypothetical protein [Deltaproteobacteria bacterium]
MRKLLVVCAVLGILLASLEAGAVIVEARGFTLCTGIDSSTHLCTAGTFWGADGILTKQAGGCDWTGTCERWEPTGQYYFWGALGVNWTCCMQTEAGEYSGTADFHYWDVESNNWNETPDWEGYIGYNPNLGGICDVAQFVYQGRETDDFDAPWNYGTSPDDRVGRCVGSALANPPTHVNTKAIEYWMD